MPLSAVAARALLPDRLVRSLAVAVLLFAVAARGQEAPAPTPDAAAEPAPLAEAEPDRLIVLPFRIHSARALGVLTESLSALLAKRLEATGELTVIDAELVKEELVERGFERSDVELQRLARHFGADAVVSGSLTALAGRFSLDVRVTAVDGARSHTIVMTSQSEEELLGRLDELASRVTSTLAGVAPSILVEVRIEGAGDLRLELMSLLTVRAGDAYDAEQAQEGRRVLEAHPKVAAVSLETDLISDGVVLRFNVVRAAAIFADGQVEEGGEVVAEVRVRGNRRIEADAIRARIRTRPGQPLSASQIAADVQEIFKLGFFANVEVYSDQGPDGLILIYEVEENPVIRQISISGNDEIEDDKIRDALTLTTGSTLDYPLLHENTARIESLYRAEGYYLAEVGFEIEELREGRVGINFEVKEGDKLQLREFIFEGNEAFTAAELSESFETSEWVPVWSSLTSWFTKSGTYSEPIFLQDLLGIDKLYKDDGYIQMERGDPQVEPRQDGLFVRVKINEGPQFRVGKLSVTGDATIDLEALREKLKLE